MNLVPFKWDKDTLFAASNGRLQVYQPNGVPVRYWMNIHERRRFDEAVQQGYVVLRPHQLSSALYRCWVAWCDIHNVPVVRVILKTKKAEVSLDLSGLPYELAEVQCETLRAALAELGVPKNYNYARFGVGMIYSTAAVPVDAARNVAQLMVRVSDEAKYNLCGIIGGEQEVL